MRPSKKATCEQVTFLIIVGQSIEPISKSLVLHTVSCFRWVRLRFGTARIFRTWPRTNLLLVWVCRFRSFFDFGEISFPSRICESSFLRIRQSTLRAPATIKKFAFKHYVIYASIRASSTLRAISAIQGCTHD